MSDFAEYPKFRPFLVVQKKIKLLEYGISFYVKPQDSIKMFFKSKLCSFISVPSLFKKEINAFIFWCCMRLTAMSVTVKEVLSHLCKIIVKTYLQIGEEVPHRSTHNSEHVKADSHTAVYRYEYDVRLMVLSS